MILILFLKIIINVLTIKIHQNDSIGIVNGLWANCLGQGGILPIESLLIPSSNFMTVKTTGSLEKVIKESIDVALSVAWNNIDDTKKTEWLKKVEGGKT